jgi:hypothetical protein
MYKSAIVVLVALLCSFRIQTGHETDKVVMQAAEGQLPVFLAKIQPGEATLFGFSDEDDLDDCTIGKPFRLLTFSRDLYSDSLAVDKDYIVTKNEWRAPVMIKGKNRTLLTVGGNPGNYVVSAMGDTTLAKELQQKSKGADENDAYYLLRIPQLPADFFVHEANNSFSEAQFIPLASAISSIHALSGAHKPFYTLTEVEQMIRKALLKDSKTTTPKKTKATTKKR